MQWPSRFPKITLPTVMIVLFFWIWFYTEVNEYNDRKQHRQEVDKFMYKGDRFTHEDGRKLEARLKALEELEGVEHGVSKQ